MKNTSFIRHLPHPMRSAQYTALGEAQYTALGEAQYTALGETQYTALGEAQYTALGEAQYTALGEALYPSPVAALCRRRGIGPFSEDRVSRATSPAPRRSSESPASV
jgi:hypothetical protein